MKGIEALHPWNYFLSSTTIENNYGFDASFIDHNTEQSVRHYRLRYSKDPY